MDALVGYFIVGFVAGLTVAAVAVFRSWERDVHALRVNVDCLRARVDEQRVELTHLNEEADLAAVVARSQHPSAGVRPLAAVVEFRPRGGVS